MILPDLDTDEALAFAEKVRRSVEQESFEVDGRRETVTVSIGVAVWPDSGETYDAVVEAAGRAMTEAKKKRNRVRVAGGESS